MKNYIFIFLSITVLFLQGCGLRYSVSIPHIFPDEPETEIRYQALSNIYLIVQKTEEYNIRTVKKQLDSGKTKTLGTNYIYFDIQSFLKSFQEKITPIGGSILAYRVTTQNEDKEDDTDPYALDLQPSAIITVQFKGFAIQKQVNEKDVKETIDGKTTTKRITETTYNGSLQLPVTFDIAVAQSLSPDEHKNITYKRVKDVITVTHEQTYTSEKSDEKGNTVLDHIFKVVEIISGDSGDSRESEIMDVLIHKAAENMADTISPPITVRERPIFRDKQQEDSKEAFKFAKKGKWDKAEEIWKSRIESNKNDWRDNMNLGVSAELKRNYSTALHHYKEAEKESVDDKKSADIQWNAIYNDISRSIVQHTSSLNPHAKKWFGRRVAVLPFSDETVSIDGPIFLRRITHRILTQGGYNTISLDEADDILRNHGFTQGGQLRAASPEKISQWLDADWLIFGHIEEFNEVNIGIYVQRNITGELSIWDAAEQDTAWSSSNYVKTDSIPSKISKQGILANFLFNLGTQWIGSIAEKPMANESYKFVITNLEKLPLRPAQQ